MDAKSTFDKLFALNVNDHTERKKNGGTELTYLSWAWAWAEFKKICPDATYTIYKDDNNRAYFGDDDIGYMVYTSVTASGLTYEMWLPVMDGANKAMLRKSYEYTTKSGKKRVEAMTMFDVNKTIMRCLTKNLAMFGLGLYIYSGEDLPETPPEPPVICDKCGKEIKAMRSKDGTIISAKDVYAKCGNMCTECYKAAKAADNKEDTINDK